MDVTSTRDARVFDCIEFGEDTTTYCFETMANFVWFLLLLQVNRKGGSLTRGMKQPRCREKRQEPRLKRKQLAGERGGAFGK